MQKADTRPCREDSSASPQSLAIGATDSRQQGKNQLVDSQSAAASEPVPPCAARLASDGRTWGGTWDRRACHCQGVSIISSNEECRGWHRRSSLGFLPSACRQGGPPARRSAVRGGTGRRGG